MSDQFLFGPTAVRVTWVRRANPTSIVFQDWAIIFGSRRNKLLLRNQSSLKLKVTVSLVNVYSESAPNSMTRKKEIDIVAVFCSNRQKREVHFVVQIPAGQVILHFFFKEVVSLLFVMMFFHPSFNSLSFEWEHVRNVYSLYITLC